MRRNVRFSLLAILFFILFCITIAAGAQTRASVEGTVTDQQGGTLQGVTVTLTDKETGKSQTTTSGDSGFYRFTNLAPGNYSISAEQKGFKKQILDNLTVNAEQTQGVNLALEVGVASETVTVNDTGAGTIETENANVDKQINKQEITQLPQVGRDPYELLRLTPGVFGDGARSSSGQSNNLPNQPGPGGSARSIFQTENQVQISANGQRVTSNDFQIDGTSVNSLTHGGAAVITPSQESVKEVQVISNNYSSEYGRNSGAQILTVSQNGTNQFHGSAFLKNDSPGLNAFNKYGGVNNAPDVRVSTHLNQFGGSFGGPLPIPNFHRDPDSTFDLGRDKAFFFFSYEGLRSSANDSAIAFVETPEYRALVEQLRPNGLTAQIFKNPGVAPRIISVLPGTCAEANYGTNSTICKEVNGRLDLGSPTGALGQYVSLGAPTGGGFDGIPDVERVQLAIPSTSAGNQYNLRLDFNLTPKDTITISGYRTRFLSTASDGSAGSRPIGDVTTHPDNKLATITYTRILSATMVNEVRINGTRFAFNEVDSSSSTNFGIPRIEIESIPFDRIRFGAPYSETTPGIFAENTFEVRDTLRKVKGNHGLSFGGEYRIEQDNNNLVGAARPLYTFGGLFNLANDTPLFYQIAANPTTGGPPVTQRYFRTHTFAAFGQDDWKFRPNITLNFGLRYEYFSPLSEKNGIMSNLIFGSGTGQELTGASIVQVKSLYPPDRNNFAPRFGFAFSPKNFLGKDLSEKVVVRGGFGVAYNRIPEVDFTNVRANPPFEARYTLCCGTDGSPFDGGLILYALGANNTPFSYPANPALILSFNSKGIPTNTIAGAKQVEIYGAPAQVPTPYVYVYSLETQFLISHSYTATIGYEGSSSHKLVRLVNQRFIFPNDPNNFFASGVFFPQEDGTANYNAMLVSLTRRLSQGIQFGLNYRWSKTIDIVSSDEVGAPTNPTFPLDPSQERGPSDFDVRHYVVGSAIYDLPFFRKRRDFVGSALGGWQISTIATYHTGFPWTPLIGNCPSSTNIAIICPVRPTQFFGGNGDSTSNSAFISGSNFPGGGQRFFSTVGATGFGGTTVPGIGRNSFRGPQYRDIDISVSKRFSLGRFLSESSAFEVKANFFNAFNILNLQPLQFNTSQTNINDTQNFGRSAGGLAGRVVEFQARLSF